MWFQADGVVEIAGGLAVDGDEGKPAQIFSVGKVLHGRIGRQARGFGEHLRWKLDPQSVLEGDGEELDFGVIRGTEYLFELTAGAALRRRRPRDAHQCDLTRVAAVAAGCRR